MGQSNSGRLYHRQSSTGHVLFSSASRASLIPSHLAAADDVQSEPLSSQFSGILGLALPLNSIIAQKVPPVTNNDPDGAAFASNLFSLTPTSSAPASRFLSLSLSRPGSDRIPALLGIGRHPTELVSDPSKIKYDTLVSEAAGSLFWKTSVRAITVYVNGEERDVQLGRSNTGAVWPSAVLDTGVPLILTTSTIANAIYGAIGVQPANDGMCELHLINFVFFLPNFLLSRLRSLYDAAQHDHHPRHPFSCLSTPSRSYVVSTIF